jgi:hypothetical protein
VGSRRLGSRLHYVLQPGQTTTLRLRLSKRGRAYAERRHRLRVTLTFVIRDATGFTFSFSKRLALRA